MVTSDEPLAISRQCELLSVARSRFYYRPQEVDPLDTLFEELVRRRIDFWHTKHCYMGFRKIAKKIQNEDCLFAGKKLIKRLMAEMGIYAIYPKPSLSKPGKHHRKFPYLLRNKSIFLPNQVWAVDITYIPMGKGHMYLTAVIDWYSRFIVGWVLSETLEAAPVVDCVKEAVEKYGIPGIINSDQGAQFTSDEYILMLSELKIRQSMDGKARWIDNVIIERWFRSLKCDYIYINDYDTPKDLKIGISSYVHEYNYERPHQSLAYDYPANMYKYSVFKA
jgi:putative transposase